MNPPLPTRESLLESLKDDLESFVFLSNHAPPFSPMNNTIDDAIARITDMLNVDNASKGEQK